MKEGGSDFCEKSNFLSWSRDKIFRLSQTEEVPSLQKCHCIIKIHSKSFIVTQNLFSLETAFEVEINFLSKLTYMKYYICIVK